MRAHCSFATWTAGIVFALICAACGSASAEILPTLSISKLVRYGDVIVLARPAETARNGERLVPVDFVVEEVFHGDPALAGKRIGVDMHLYSDRHVPPSEPLPRRNKRPQFSGSTKIDRALLFLRKPEQVGEYVPVVSGVRLLTGSGDVLVPVQSWGRPGPYGFQADESADWNATLEFLRSVPPLYFANRNALSGWTSPAGWVGLVSETDETGSPFQIALGPSETPLFWRPASRRDKRRSASTHVGQAPPDEHVD